jgi:tRNA G37 N-methylase Trm5
MKVHYTKIGDIALLKIPDEQNHNEYEIAHEIIEKEHSIKVVIRAYGRYGEFRKQDSKILIGNRTDTIYTEFGMKFHVDVKESYFSEREKTERQRLKNSAHPHEQILILFAGVGVIPLIIAQEKEVTITAVEKNPRAFSLMEENISRNQIRGSIVPVLRDVYTFAGATYDRVIVPQPYGHHSFSIAAPFVKEGGYLHYYAWKSMHTDPEPFPGFAVCTVKTLFSYAPGIWKVCYDLEKVSD